MHNKELAAVHCIESAKAKVSKQGNFNYMREHNFGYQHHHLREQQGFSNSPSSSRVGFTLKKRHPRYSTGRKGSSMDGAPESHGAMEAATRWLALRERQQILKEQITLAQELYATLKEQQERGERSQLDLSLADIQIKGLELKQPALKSSIHSLENEMRSLVGQQAEEPFRLEATWKPMAIPSASPLDTANHPAFGVLHTEASIHHAMVALEQSRKWEDGPWAYPTSGGR